MRSSKIPLSGRVTLCISALIILGALLTFGSTSASAVVPDSINYSGVLKSAGSPVPDGNHTVTFKIYSVAGGGAPLWTETQSVTTSTGLFNVFLGMMTPLPASIFSAPNRFLGITVAPDVDEMTPRTPIVAVPYAYRIATVDGATGGAISGDVSVSGGNLDLDTSTATTGNILKGGVLFISGFGADNTFIGRNAGNLTMSGQANTGSGSNALSHHTTGYANTASGDHALYSNTIGNYNTACGFQALYSNISGDENTASGGAALNSNIAGYDNTASGWKAMYRNTSGFANTASGSFALANNSTGTSNTADGTDALRNNSTGFNNTASGYFALYQNNTGSNNTGIGYGADVSSDALTNATAIGANTVVDASNKIRLGNGAVTVIEGQVAYTFTSDKNQKENFKPVDGDEVLRKMRGLGLSSWNYKGQNPQQFRHYGPVAQEFFAAFGHDGVGTSGTPTTINSGDEAGILMIAVQELEKKNEALEKRTEEIAGLKAQIAELREMISAQASKQK